MARRKTNKNTHSKRQNKDKGMLEGVKDATHKVVEGVKDAFE